MNEIRLVAIQNFLKDIEQRGECKILAEGQESDEVFAIAKAKGILVKNSIDLAAFKNVYALVDIPNKNGDVMTTDEVLKALPSLTGKPVNINHIIDRVVGYLIDYKYIAKEKKIIVYGILFKYAFAKDFSRMQNDHGKKKLRTSYEIWTPKNQIKKTEKGLSYMGEIQFGGQAILFDKPPAFEEAEMLKLSAECLNEMVLIKASKEEYELITADSIINKEDDKQMNKLQEMFKTIAKIEEVTEELVAEYLKASQEDQALISAENKQLVADFLSKKSQLEKEAAEAIISKEKLEAERKEKAADDVVVGYEKELAALKEKQSLTATLIAGNEKIIAELKDKITAQETLANTVKAESEKVIAELNGKLTEKDNEIINIKTESEKKISMYKDNAQKIIARRAELGDSAKDMTDELILDEKEFELAGLRKKVAELQRTKITASDKVGDEPQKVIADKEKIEAMKKRDEALINLLTSKK